MNILTPLILIIISIGTFFAYIDPNYRGQNLANGEKSVQQLQKEESDFQTALTRSSEIRAKRQQLQDKKGSFDLGDLAKLEKLLPDNIDNIKLIIDITNIATKHNLELKGAKLETGVKTDSNKLGAVDMKYGTVGISFSVTASYAKFQDFIADLEKSLRLVEITDLAVNGNTTGLYDFSIGLKTYWLK